MYKSSGGLESTCRASTKQLRDAFETLEITTGHRNGCERNDTVVNKSSS